MANPTTWDQTKFDAALRSYTDRLKNEKVPKAITKKGFFIALRAFKATVRKDPFEITKDLARVVTVADRGRQRQVPIGWVIAAKRLGKKWHEQKMSRGIKNKTGKSNLLKLYRSALAKTFNTMLGSRKRASGFLRVGWLSVVKKLGPSVSNRGGAPAADLGSVKIRGVMKGDAKAAAAGIRPTCTLTNSAQAHSDKRYGLIRYGTPGLQEAFDLETRDTVEYLENELKEATEKANRDLK